MIRFNSSCFRRVKITKEKILVVLGIYFYIKWSTCTSKVIIKPVAVSPDLRLKLYKLQGLFPHNVDSGDVDLRLNVSYSNKIGLMREQIDTRHEACKTIEYHDNNLPTASVVIPFYNEIWSVLLRTVTGILFRSPPHLLKEIILVDDASTFEFLGAPLEAFLSQIPNARVIRHKQRVGLIQTRMTGAKAATGDVIIFLDAHIEVSPQWLEPILDTLQKQPRLLITPGVDVINPDNFETTYDRALRYSGVFTWDFIHSWQDIPEAAQKKRHTEAFNAPSATIVACAIAVNREVFFELGAFDEGMSIWGGENIEISWRYWMCGDGVQVVPCSRVGHLFRRFLPYGIKEGVVEMNYQRAVDVWLDDYKQYYYAAVQKRFVYTDEQLKSLQERKELRQRLQCHSFQWYMDNVVPDMFVPWRNATLQGIFWNLAAETCLVVRKDGKLGLGSCSKFDRNTYFYWLKDKRLYYNYTHCVTPQAEDGPLKVTRCPERVTADYQWNFITNIDNAVTRAAGGRRKPNNNSTLVRIESNVSGVKKCLSLTMDSHWQARGQSWVCNYQDNYAHWYVAYNMNFDFYDRIKFPL